MTKDTFSQKGFGNKCVTLTKGETFSFIRDKQKKRILIWNRDSWRIYNRQKDYNDTKYDIQGQKSSFYITGGKLLQGL